VEFLVRAKARYSATHLYYQTPPLPFPTQVSLLAKIAVEQPQLLVEELSTDGVK